MVLLFGLDVVFYIAIVMALISPSFRVAFSRLLATPLPHHQRYLASVDGLRGLAALWVACFHCRQWTKPHYDQVVRYVPFLNDSNAAVPILVPVFVVLSGFLIYRSVRAITGLAELKKYAWRRWLRIYPLYFVTTIVAFAVVPIAGLKPERVAAEFLMLRALAYPDFLNPQTWSLYVEVLFYTVVPVYAIASRRHPLVSAVLALVSCSIIGIYGNREITLWKFFAAGICVSCLYDLFGSKKNDLLWGIIFLCGIGSLSYLHNQHTTLSELALPFAIICLVFGCLVFRPASAFLRSHPLRILGAISYSIFLWHSFIIMIGYGVMFDGTGFLVGSFENRVGRCCSREVNSRKIGIYFYLNSSGEASWTCEKYSVKH